MAVSMPVMQRGLILFWGLWFSIVTLSNLFDALKALGVLPAGWRLASGNWRAVRHTLGDRTPAPVAALLFAGTILWEALAAFLYGRALIQMSGGAVLTAFGVGAALFAAFVLFDELFVEFEMGAQHLRFFTAQLVTLITLLLLQIVQHML